MKLPHVSIIMPCYNAAAHLARSMKSVQAQTFGDWELVAIDDGSTDDTAERLRTMAASDPRIRVIEQANGGVSRARNHGLANARGSLIAFLDADDEWSPDFLALMTTALDARPDAVLAYCGWQNVGLAGGRGHPFIPPDYETPLKRQTLFEGCRWPIHATLTRRDAVASAGGFDTTLRNAEDYAMWLRIAGCASIVRVQQVLAFYHFHSDTQASRARGRAALDFADAQLDYLAEHPDFAGSLGRHKARQLVFGTLLTQGNECFWKGRLKDAHLIFRRVMAARYGGFADWLRMLPALLPEAAYCRLLSAVERLRSMRTSS